MPSGVFVSPGATMEQKTWRLLIITEEIRMAKRNGNRLPPIHPGEILREEFLKPLGMSAPELAVALCVPATRINEIVNERRGISASTALRLSRYFGTTPKFWLNLQGSYELEAAQDRLGKSIQREVLPRSA
jgi:addiction module HigA family antidote